MVVGRRSSFVGRRRRRRHPTDVGDTAAVLAAVENGPTLVMINGGFIRGDRLYGPGADITARDVRRKLPFPGTMADDESGYKYLPMF